MQVQRMLYSISFNRVRKTYPQWMKMPSFESLNHSGVAREANHS
jgi:hypothetical protein